VLGLPGRVWDVGALSVLLLLLLLLLVLVCKPCGSVGKADTIVSGTGRRRSVAEEANSSMKPV
jgi:hypothetical protein